MTLSCKLQCACAGAKLIESLSLAYYTNSRQLKNENLRILVIIEVHLKTNFALIHSFAIPCTRVCTYAKWGFHAEFMRGNLPLRVSHQFAPIQVRYLRLYSQRKTGHRADKIQLCTSHTLAEGSGLEKRGKVIALRGSTNLGECDTQRAPVRIKLIRACGSYACVYII